METAPACVGCLDSHRCWVCLGTGKLEGADARYVRCHRCAGTAACFVCCPPTVVQLLDVPKQRETLGSLRLWFRREESA